MATGWKVVITLRVPTVDYERARVTTEQLVALIRQAPTDVFGGHGVHHEFNGVSIEAVFNGR